MKESAVSKSQLVEPFVCPRAGRSPWSCAGNQPPLGCRLVIGLEPGLLRFGKAVGVHRIRGPDGHGLLQKRLRRKAKFGCNQAASRSRFEISELDQRGDAGVCQPGTLSTTTRAFTREFEGSCVRRLQCWKRIVLHGSHKSLPARGSPAIGRWQRSLSIVAGKFCKSRKSHSSGYELDRRPSRHAGRS